MTREAFLTAYRIRLVKHCDWAADAEKLDKFMCGVRETISRPGNSTWSFDTLLSREAWYAIGGKGKPTLTALRQRTQQWRKR